MQKKNHMAVSSHGEKMMRKPWRVETNQTPSTPHTRECVSRPVAQPDDPFDAIPPLPPAASVAHESPAAVFRQVAVILFIALAIIVVSVWRYCKSMPPPDPVGITTEGATAEMRFAKAKEYRSHADVLRKKGLDGWDDKPVLREALANYLAAWELLTGTQWRSEITWCGAREYVFNDDAKTVLVDTEADVLKTVLRDRIIEMEDATDACGLW